MIAGLCVLAAAAILSFRPIYEPDLWWHLAHGRENASGHVVRTNLFSFNYPDYRQEYTSWLFDTTAFLAWSAGGPTAIQVMQTTLVALTFALVYFACRLRSSASSAAAVLILGFFLLEPRAIPRPHLASFAGLAAYALLLERAIARRSAAPLWWCVPIVALWSNVHVECIFAIALVVIVAVTEFARPAALPRSEAKRALIVAAVCLAATLANPYGWGLLTYAFENRTVPQLLAIAELQPPPLVPYRAFYLYLAACVALLAFRWRTVTLREVVVAAVFAVLGLRYIRLTPLMWLATAPIVAGHLDAMLPRRAARLAIVVAATGLGLAASRIPPRLLFTGFTIGAPAVAPEAFFSSKAMDFVGRAGLEGPLFNSHNLGGFVAWSLYPRTQIFQDARLQAYPPEHFLSILVASRSQPDWDLLVADVDWAMVSLPRPNQLSGVGRFPAQEWAVVYRDEAVEIIVRRAGKYGKLVNTSLPASRYQLPATRFPLPARIPVCLPSP
jgi:hypothetical protein